MGGLRGGGGGLKLTSQSGRRTTGNVFVFMSQIVENGNQGEHINPHLPSGSVHPHQLDESISNFRGVWWYFFIFIRIDIPVSKQ